MKCRAAVGVALTLAVCGPGCGQSMGLPELRGGIEMAVRRGAAWTTLSVKPPYIIGPRTNLTLKHGLLRGAVDGRAVSIQVEEHRAHGQGPFGSVAYEIHDGDDAIVVDGTWNGSRVHLRVTSQSFRGTVPVSGGTSISDVQSCQYVLDTLEPDGAWSGTSTCHGMPEPTRLEVPGKIQDWLTRSEMTVLVLALLSSFPSTAMEGSFGRLTP